MADSKQPTILVKKADGTKVRVSLEEFKKMRAGELSQGGQVGNEESVKSNEERGMENPEKLRIGTSEEPSQTAGKSEMIDNEQKTMSNEPTNLQENNVPEEKVEVPQPPAPPSPPQSVTLVKKNVAEVEIDAPVADENELSTTTPVADIFVNEAAANFEWDEKDKKSLMDEDLSEVEDLKKKGAVHVGQHDLEEHIKMPAVGIEDDLKNRAKSLMISWKKGIRNEFQVMDYAMKDVEHGGLGLSEEQATRFFEKLKESKGNLDNLFEIVFEKKSNTEEPTKKEEKVVMEMPKKEVATKSETMTPVAKVETETPPQFTMPVKKEVNLDFSQPYSHTPPRSAIYDVTPPPVVAKTTGPKQEIADFSLVDYRRLARDAEKCADMLLSKFNGWKSESFMLFLDTIDGWHMSNLFKMYVETTSEAINKNITVEQFLQNKDPKTFLTLEEYKSLIGVDSSLLN